MRVSAIIYILGSTLLMSLSASGQGDAAKLIGTKKCAMCHKKADKGNQYGVWQSKAHSKAYEMLASEESKAIAAKMGIDHPQTSGQCLKCHSTAYFFTETVQSEAVAVADGVSCESCHGPGADYKKKSIMASREASIAGGMIYPAKEKSCTQCHNDTGPTWDPNRYTLPDGTKTGFDANQAYEKIKHERPAIGRFSSGISLFINRLAQFQEISIGKFKRFRHLSAENHAARGKRLGRREETILLHPSIHVGKTYKLHSY